MSLIVTGSIGVDTITTPFGCNHDCIGGSAVYFSLAASFFTNVNFIGVTGEDCPFDLNEFFAGRNVNMDGLEIRKGSKTFRWTGSYEGTMNEARTDAVELNVLAGSPAACAGKLSRQRIRLPGQYEPGAADAVAGRDGPYVVCRGRYDEPVDHDSQGRSETAAGTD